MTHPAEYTRPAATSSDPAVKKVQFRDPDMQDRYDTHGMLKTPLLESYHTRFLASRCAEILADAPAGFVSTVLMNADQRCVAHDVISEILAPLLAQHLRFYRLVLASFIVRQPGSGQGDLPLHQDWSFVDEKRASSLGVWITLQDVTAENGCLQMVPGSHRHDQPTLRGMGSGFRYHAIEPMLREKYLLDIPMACGEAMFFDHRLIHGSTSNRTATPRLAIGAVLIPKQTPLHMGFRRHGQWQFEDRPDRFLLDADLAGLAVAA